MDLNSLKKSKTMSEKIEREIKCLSKLKHPHVVRVFETFETDNMLFVVMELLEKGELFDLIAKNGKVFLK